jgi:glucose-1-phosphate thymidylyltransferase
VDVKALILAAGYATRLYPLTLQTPKHLLEVADRPMVDWVLDRLDPLAGLDAVYLVTNAKFAPAFAEWAAARGEGRVTVIDDGTESDDDKLGAIGDIGLALDREEIDDDLIVIAGDNLFTGGIDGFVAEGRRRDRPVLAVYDVGDPELMPQFNTIETDADGRITYFEEKPQHARSTLAGIALYWYPRSALPLVHAYLAEEENHDQPGRLVQWLYTRMPVYAWELPGEWYDIGTPEQLEAARAEFAAKSKH